MYHAIASFIALLLLEGVFTIYFSYLCFCLYNIYNILDHDV